MARRDVVVAAAVRTPLHAPAHARSGGAPAGHSRVLEARIRHTRRRGRHRRRVARRRTPLRAQDPQGDGRVRQDGRDAARRVRGRGPARGKRAPAGVGSGAPDGTRGGVPLRGGRVRATRCPGEGLGRRARVSRSPVRGEPATDRRSGSVGQCGQRGDGPRGVARRPVRDCHGRVDWTARIGVRAVIAPRTRQRLFADDVQSGHMPSTPAVVPGTPGRRHAVSGRLPARLDAGALRVRLEHSASSDRATRRLRETLPGRTRGGGDP